jgi:nicotinamide riboside transporter PnuC
MTTITYTRPALRVLGTMHEHKEGAIVALLMLVATIAYESVASFMPDYAFNIWAFLGVWTGLTTVWLTRTENILCWPWGIVSAAAFGWFFGEIGLVGQQWLNWGFFLTVQVWAWYYWVSGGKEENDLPVTRMSWGSRSIYLALIALGTWLIYSWIEYFRKEESRELALVARPSERHLDLPLLYDGRIRGDSTLHCVPHSRSVCAPYLVAGFGPLSREHYQAAPKGAAFRITLEPI